MKNLITVSLVLALSTWGYGQQTRIYVHLDTAIKQPLSGRLFVFTQKDTTKGISGQIDITNPQPAYELDVRNWTSEKPVVLDNDAHFYGVPMNEMAPGFYKVGGVIDLDHAERGLNNPGNYYSPKDVIFKVSASGNNETHLYFTKQFKPRVFQENDSVKEVKLKSPVLSAFRKQDMFMKAAVVLPQGYRESPAKKYPVVFIIPGWGGTHYDALGSGPRKRYGMGMGKEKIYVYLNPETQSPFGLHAFVDSRVNGPWGAALVEELIPYLEINYPVDTDPSQHFVMGQSTGGYGALWLQLNYPKDFGGCWAVSPDPVDFSNFTGVDLYHDRNFYQDASGREFPFFLDNGVAASTLKKEVALETFMGDGEQQQAFEAEFGLPGNNGRPQEFFDRKTGVINDAVIRTWRPYDLALYLQQNWGRIGSDLAGKVHVYAGAEDNFFLDRAVASFGNKARAMHADVVAEVVPSSNHFTIWSPAFTRRVQSEIDARIK